MSFSEQVFRSFEQPGSHVQPNEVSQKNQVTQGDTRCYYRTTGTSPLIPHGVPAHSTPNNAIFNSAGRPYDELESEDDLDREDITFPLDQGS